jgi:hypothetical protein
MKIGLCFLGGVLLCVQAAWAAKPLPLVGPQEEPPTAYEIGLKHYESGEFQKAIPYFKRATLDSGLYWQATVRKGIAHFYLQEYHQASSEFRTILKNEQAANGLISGTARFYYGVLLYARMRLDAAEDHLSRVLTYSVAPELKQEAQSLLKEIHLLKELPVYQSAQKYSLSGFLEEQFGYNSNAQVTRNGIGSWYNQNVAFVAYDSPQAQSWRFGLQYFGYLNLFLSRSVNTFDSLLHGPTLQTSYDLNEERSLRLSHSFGINWFYNRSGQGFKSFSTTYEFGSQVDWDPVTGWIWTGQSSLQYVTQNRDRSNFNDITGWAPSVGIGVKREFDELGINTFQALLDGAYYFYRGTDSQYYEIKATGRYRHSFSDTLSLESELQGKWQTYPKHSSSRIDWVVRPSVLLDWNFLDWLSLQPNAAFTYNMSNVLLSHYTRFEIFLNLDFIHSLTF